MVVILAAASLANQPAIAQNFAPAAQDQIYSVLTGSWTGRLEYRDFQSDRRVALPTWLDVKLSPGGKTLEFVYTYDDGPTKTVTELSTVAIDPVKRLFTITSDRDHSTDTYEIRGMDALKAGRGTLTLTGTGTENNKPVDVRITVKIDRNLYEFTKETRLPGQEFNFRDGYTLTRRMPAQ
jgi:hypothetical protein